MGKILPHDGEVYLQLSFDNIWENISQEGIDLRTAVGSPFTVKATITKKGLHSGERTLRFFKEKQEFARAYPC